MTDLSERRESIFVFVKVIVEKISSISKHLRHLKVTAVKQRAGSKQYVLQVLPILPPYSGSIIRDAQTTSDIRLQTSDIVHRTMAFLHT